MLERDNCILTYQSEGAEYVKAGRIKEYVLSPEELAEIHKKYGPPGAKQPSHNCFVSATRGKSLMASAGKNKKEPKAGKIKVEKSPKVKRPKEKKQNTPKPKREHPHTRHVTKEELESALEGRTLEEAREILHIGRENLYKFISQYGINYYNRHLTVRTVDGKVCGICKTFKAWDQFNKNKSMIDGYENRCRECSNEYRRARRAERKAKV